MRKIILSLFILLSVTAKCQLTSIVLHGDTMFALNPATGSLTQLNKLVPAPAGNSGKAVSTNGTVYNWVDFQAPLVAGTTIKNINGSSILGSGNLTIATGSGDMVAANNLSDIPSPSTARTNLGLVIGTNVLAPNGNGSSLTGLTEGQISGLISDLAAKQATITTGTTAQYFRGDLSLATFPTTTAGFSNSTDKNFVTDAKLTVLNNTTGTNSGDNAVNSLYSGLVTNATHTGDATGSGALTVVGINGTNLAGLGTGIVKLSSGTPSMAAQTDITGLLGTNSITNTMINSVDCMKLTAVSGATSSTTGGQTVTMGTNGIYTCTPTGSCTFNASGGTAGQRVTFIFTTSGTTSFTMTFGSSFTSTGTLATGTTTGKKFCVSFLCYSNGNWIETGRTTAQ